MSQRVVYFNGRFVPESEARVSIYDSALTLGDMAYEVTRTCHGTPFRLREHIERLRHSLAVIGVDPRMTADELHAVTLETVRRNRELCEPHVDFQIIHNVSRGPAAGYEEAFLPAEFRPTVIVSCYPLTQRLARLAPAYQTGIDLVLVRQRAIPGELLDAEIKTRSRLHFQLANLEAQRRGGTAVLLDPTGHLTEGTSGNLFLVRGGAVLTPARGNLLPGFTRGLVLDLARQLGLPAEETQLTPRDAALADELFVTSTSIGILHARSFDGTAVGGGALGNITARLRAALDAAAGVNFAAQARAYAEIIGRNE